MDMNRTMESTRIMRMRCDHHEETVPLMESHIAEIERHLGILQPAIPVRPTSTRRAEVGSGITTQNTMPGVPLGENSNHQAVQTKRSIAAGGVIGKTEV